MMQLASGTQVWLSCRPTDMRKGFDGLAAQVKNVLSAEPFSGHLFVFRGKRGDYLKALYWDGSGLCLFAGTERVTGTHPERVSGTHLGFQSGHSGQEWQSSVYSGFRSFLDFIDSRKR